MREMGRYRLKARRERLGLTQFDLAERAGIRHSAQISMAENGRATERIVQQVRCALYRIETERRAKRREELYIATAEACWAALPDSPEKTALLNVFTARIRALYDEAKWEQGDIILKLLPKDLARALLDEYFDDEI